MYNSIISSLKRFYIPIQRLYAILHKKLCHPSKDKRYEFESIISPRNYTNSWRNCLRDTISLCSNNNVCNILIYMLQVTKLSVPAQFDE